LGYTLVSLHNITFLIRHMEQIRAAIITGTLRDYAKEFLDLYLHRM